MCFGKASWLFPICCCQATLSQPLLELLWFSWFSQLMTFVASDIHKTGLQIKNGNFPSQAHFSDPSGKGEVRTSTNSPRFWGEDVNWRHLVGVAAVHWKPAAYVSFVGKADMWGLCLFVLEAEQLCGHSVEQAVTSLHCVWHHQKQ